MEGKPCILFDPSPAAAFIAHHYVHHIDGPKLEAAFEEILGEKYEDSLRAKLEIISGRELRTLRDELDWLYETRCDRCDGKATTDYLVYSQTFQCPNCGEIVALLNCPEAPVEYPRTGKNSEPENNRKSRRVCPACYQRHRNVGRPDFVISTRMKVFGEVPVEVVYSCENGCRPRRDSRKDGDESKRKARNFRDLDLQKLSLLQKCDIPHPCPKRFMMDVEDRAKPWGMEWRPGRDFRTIEELYTKRNFWALAAIADRAKRLGEVGNYLRLTLTAISLNSSKMYRYRPSGKGGIKNGSYYLPPLAQIMSVKSQFADKLRDVVKAQSALVNSIPNDIGLVSNQSNSAMNQFPPDSLDYIFTDPPYAEKTQYGELNFVWEAWLGFDSSWHREETVVKEAEFDPERIYTKEAWEQRIRGAFRSAYRALKPGRWMSVCYHDTAEGTWRRVQDALLDIGFEVHSVTVLDPLQKSANQLTAEKVVKSDLVLNCRKPKEGELQLTGHQESPPHSVKERVRTILEDTLGASPGQTRDKLFDTVTRRLLERAQFAEHRFEDILREVADPAEGDRWYLKSEFEQLSQSDLASEEKAGDGLIRFARLRCVGSPAKYAAVIALAHVGLCELNSKGKVDEEAVEEWINGHLLKEDRELLLKKNKKTLELGGTLKGIEFYDALFFYFTKYMKGMRANQLPRRNLAEFLSEYLVRFRDGEDWLYRPPNLKEESDLKAARRSGLGRRIRAFANALREGDRNYVESHRPDVRTFVEWLRYCAAYGYFEDGATLYESGGFTVDQLKSITIDEEEEETAYDVARGYADICKRRLGGAEQLRLDDQEMAEEEGE